MNKKINLKLTLDDNPLFLERFAEEEKSRIIEEFNKKIKDKYYIEFKKDDTVIKKGHKRKAETMKVPLDGVIHIKSTCNEKKPYNFLSSITYETHIHLLNSTPIYFTINL